MISMDLRHKGLRYYGYLAGVSQRTITEDMWVQRLYGLLLGLGMDVNCPVDVDTHERDQIHPQSHVRDVEFNEQMEKYFMDVEKELNQFRS